MCSSLFKKYIAEFVYGGIDGTITTFAIVAGALGAHLSLSVALMLGFANIFADGFSMASSSYLAERTQNKSALQSLIGASITFISFTALGSLPLISLVAQHTNASITQSTALLLSLLTAMGVFVIIGAIKATISHKHIFASILETLLIGVTAAGIAYFVGQFAQSII